MRLRGKLRAASSELRALSQELVFCCILQVDFWQKVRAKQKVGPSQKPFVVNRVSKVETRRIAIRQKVKEILEGMANGETEVYVGYRQLYQCWCGNNVAVPELRLLFQIPGLSADSRLSVDDAFNAQVLAVVRSIAPQFSR